MNTNTDSMRDTHTPTPWHSSALYKRNERGISSEPDKNGVSIAIAEVCDHPAHPGLTAANAAFIAAACNSHDDLVSSLQAILLQVQKHGASAFDFINDDLTVLAFAQARRALAKATGV